LQRLLIYQFALLWRPKLILQSQVKQLLTMALTLTLEILTVWVKLMQLQR
jgi:hypothetical protein